MAKLTYAERQELPDSAFVFPSRRETDGYPIPDKSHARNALARVDQYGTPKEKAAVCRAVKRKYPSIVEKHCKCRHCKLRRELNR